MTIELKRDRKDLNLYHVKDWPSLRVRRESHGYDLYYQGECIDNAPTVPVIRRRIENAAKWGTIVPYPDALPILAEARRALPGREWVAVSDGRIEAGGLAVTFEEFIGYTVYAGLDQSRFGIAGDYAKTIDEALANTRAALRAMVEEVG